MSALPELMPGQLYNQDLATKLSTLAGDASNARTDGRSGPLHEHYLRFTESALLQLRNAIRPSSIDRLIANQRYWKILDLDRDPSTRALRELADLELQDCQARFLEASDAVKIEAAQWQYAGAVLVPDTNIFLHTLIEPIAKTDWRTIADLRPLTFVTLVLLMPVIDELDRTKHTNFRSKARQTLNELDELLAGSTSTRLSIPGGDITLKVLVDDVEHVPLPHADSEIVDRALTLHSRAPASVTILTGDSGMTLRARRVGLKCIKLQTEDKRASA